MEPEITQFFLQLISLAGLDNMPLKIVVSLQPSILYPVGGLVALGLASPAFGF